jgi:hypothetical protein
VAFGSSTFDQVFNAFHASDEFYLNPAVRTPSGPCVDESNCNYEKVTLCSFNQTSSGQGSGVAKRAAFLVCMDKTTKTSDAIAAATPCAAQENFDMKQITACYNGAQGTSLLGGASKLWNKYFPERTTIPKIVVAGTVVDSQDYSAIKEAICKAGSTSSACKGYVSTSPTCEV